MPFLRKPDPSYCACGELWEFPCKCPENVLERFSETVLSANRAFYFDTFREWMIAEFGKYDADLCNTVLNLEGVVELGTDMYRTPYEV
jgi:hypothetical protein